MANVKSKLAAPDTVDVNPIWADWDVSNWADFATIIGVLISLAVSGFSLRQSNKSIKSSEYDINFGSRFRAGVDVLRGFTENIHAISANADYALRASQLGPLLSDYNRYTSPLLLSCGTMDGQFETTFADRAEEIVDLIVDSLHILQTSTSPSVDARAKGMCQDAASKLQVLLKANHHLQINKLKKAKALLLS